ncbi:recombinase RecT [Alloprevotella tannerae]|nr:MAG TPA: RecT protein [Podoviridae sp. ctgx11]
MPTEIVTQKNPISAFKAMINAPSVQEQFKNALGNHKDAFIASLIDLFTSDASLQQCDPGALIKEALRAAVMQLPLNKTLGFAFVVTFNNSVKNPNGTYTKVKTPTFMLGYKGYIQLAMRTGQYLTINADFVYEGEMRNVDKLTGAIAFDGEKKSDKIVGYFCHFELINGFKKTMYMSVEDMAKYALKYSPSFRGRNKPTLEALIKKAQSVEESSTVGWLGNFNDMALKTVIRRLLGKYGYLSVEMTEAISHESVNESIAQEGAQEKEIITLDEEEYKQVDTATGEILDAAPKQIASNEENPADAAPQY